jgi:hypothetical protein
MNESKKKQGKKEKALLKSPSKLDQCTFGWDRLKEMKDNKTEFFAGDGYKRLRIIEIEEKTRSIHMVCELGKITWPLSYKKLEEVHQKIHAGKVALIPYEIDKLLPTWGNFVAGLFRYLGCDRT